MSAKSNSDATQALLSLCEAKSRWKNELTPEAVKKAVAEGADVNAGNKYSQTALHLAVQSPYTKGEPLPSVDVVRALIEAGADVNARDAHQQTPLIHAVSYEPDKASEDRALEIIRVLRAAGGKVPSEVTDRSGGAFRLSTEALYREVLDAGATVNVRDDSGQTPLHRAMGVGKPELVKLLLERGADVNAIDGLGRTPLGVGLRTKEEVWVAHNKRTPGFVAAINALEAAGGKASVPIQHDPTDPFAPFPIDEAALTKALEGKKLSFKHAVSSAQELATGLHSFGDPSDALDKLEAVSDVLGVEERTVRLKGPLTLKRAFFHHGDLEVDGDLDIQKPFAVTGDVIVHGVVRDAGNDSLVNILGDLKCHALYTDGEFSVGGDIEARDVVLGYYNDHILSADTIRAKVVIEDEHAVDATVEAEHHFDIDTYAQGYGDGVADDLRAIFVDQVFEGETDKPEEEESEDEEELDEEDSEVEDIDDGDSDDVDDEDSDDDDDEADDDGDSDDDEADDDEDSDDDEETSDDEDLDDDEEASDDEDSDDDEADDDDDEEEKPRLDKGALFDRISKGLPVFRKAKK
ncbi:ankyrin repeat domain-containing protein [Myxococcus sp. CA051A]|uniref:ankyrin repeat domain-containing protein n=1 Tax=Myxococcus sp. CA051A TaxID=2741739 RepID=UPI00157B8DF5|nr:ankyrin repeat domain-containing protein [Myxococcus sp. CA051A]NTX60625.1 ankyrin repeat domain-containing protein [Myxococcus sp. CA051A]